MTDQHPPAPGWWLAVDGQWYAPELHPDHVAAAPPGEVTETLDLRFDPAPTVEPEPTIELAPVVEPPRSRFAPPPDVDAAHDAPPAPYTPPTPVVAPTAPYAPPSSPPFAPPTGPPVGYGPPVLPPQFPPPSGPPVVPAAYGAPAPLGVGAITGYGPPSGPGAPVPPTGPVSAPSYLPAQLPHSPFAAAPSSAPQFPPPTGAPIGYGPPGLPPGVPVGPYPPGGERVVMTVRPARSARTPLIVGAVALVVLALVVAGVLIATSGGGLPSIDEDRATLQAALPTAADVPSGSVKAPPDAMGFDAEEVTTETACDGSKPPAPRAAAQVGYTNEADMYFGAVFAMSFQDEAQASAFYDAAVANLDCAEEQMDLPEELAGSVKFAHESTDVDGAQEAEAVDVDLMFVQMSMLMARNGRYVTLGMSTGADGAEDLVRTTLGRL